MHYATNIRSLSWFWRCKEHLCPLCHHLGLWRMLEVHDWIVASWSWFGYGHWSLIYQSLEFWLSILILKVQGTSMYLKSWFGSLKHDRWSQLGFGILILIQIWSLIFDQPNSKIGLSILIWRYKEHPCSSNPDFRLWRMLEVPDWGLTSWSWFKYGHCSLLHIYSEFCLSILILKVQRISSSFKS